MFFEICVLFHGKDINNYLKSVYQSIFICKVKCEIKILIYVFLYK